MTTQHDKPKRWRPRFSVRTLTVIVTLICAYFGSWELTKRGAKSQIDEEMLDDLPVSTRIWVPVDSGSPCPFIIWVEVSDWPDSFYISGESYSITTHYFWFFGQKVRINGPGLAYTPVQTYTDPPDPEDPFGSTSD